MDNAALQIDFNLKIAVLPSVASRYVEAKSRRQIGRMRIGNVLIFIIFVSWFLVCHASHC